MLASSDYCNNIIAIATASIPNNAHYLWHCWRPEPICIGSGKMEDHGTGEYEKARALLTGYLNERMRVTISDGRVIDGRLICTDRDCNLVLSNCEEFLSKEEISKWLRVRITFWLRDISTEIHLVCIYSLVPRSPPRFQRSCEHSLKSWEWFWRRG